MTLVARPFRRPAAIGVLVVCCGGNAAWAQDLASFAGMSWPPASVRTMPGEVAESSAATRPSDPPRLIVRGRASTEFGSHRAYAYVNPPPSPIAMGAASVFSDLLTIEALSTSTIPGSGTASIEASQIPVLRADISGWIVDSRPSAWVGPAFEIRYLALLSKTELPLETFAEYLVGQAPKPDGTFNVIDATWDEELFANTRGQHPFLATLRGALAYQLDEATVRYGGWAYSGFFLLAGEYVELDFFNTVRVSVELPSGATLSSASGFDYAAAPVPEPSAAAMLILGLAMLGYYSCRSGVGRAGHGRAA